MRRPRTHPMTRLEALSDAVFAFAATLLVVSLEVPSTFAELERQLPGFVAFGVGFGALMLIWSAHNGFFRRYGLDDAWTKVINSVLLFVILFFVYPLKFVAQGFVYTLSGVGTATGSMLGNFEELARLFALYGLGFVTVFFCFVLLHHRAVVQADVLGLSPSERFDAKVGRGYYSIYAGVGALSVVLALTGVGIYVAVPGWIYGAIGPIAYWHGKRADRRRQELGFETESDAPSLAPTPAPSREIDEDPVTSTKTAV